MVGHACAKLRLLIGFFPVCAAQLTHLRILRLRRCMQLNDHCLSLVGQITQSPLEYLDVSECPRITANGITALTELKSVTYS